MNETKILSRNGFKSVIKSIGRTGGSDTRAWDSALDHEDAQRDRLALLDALLALPGLEITWHVPGESNRRNVIPLGEASVDALPVAEQLRIGLDRAEEIAKVGTC